MLFGSGARRVVAAEAGTADGDALRIHIGALLEPVDASTHRHLVVMARVHLVPAQRPALSRAVDHQNRHAALHGAAPGHEPELVLEGIEAAEGNEHRPWALALWLDEIRGQRRAALVRNRDDLAGQVARPLLARALALREGGQAPRVGGGEPELRGTIVVGRAQPAVHRRADVAGAGASVAPRGGALTAPLPPPTRPCPA